MQNIITNKNAVYNENALYYFYKDICVDKICESVVKIFADARYKMYINGVLAAVGPCKRTAEIKYYDIVDITKYLKIGVNNIEIQVLQLSNDSYHRGENLLQTVICDGMTGLCYVI